MECMTVNDIVKATGGRLLCGDGEMELKHISIDSRTMKGQDLFVPIIGEKVDAHRFISQAFEAGAAAVLTSEHNEMEDTHPWIRVEDTKKALQAVGKYYRSRLSLPLVGITGSVGKTTTKEMIALVLSEKFNCLKTAGNLNNEIGLPKTLFTMDSSHTAAVIEMGMSDFGEIERLSKTAAPTIGVITNIGFSHIENLKTQEGILKAKLEILKGMKQNAPLVLNGDDPYLSPLKKELSGERPVILFGIENKESDFRGSEITEFDGKTSFYVKLTGMDDSEIAAALKKYRTDGLRQNIVKKGENTLIIDCYNASPDSMKATLEVLSGMKTNGRKIAVLGDMLELGKESEKLHRLVGRYVCSARPDMLFCFGRDAEFIQEEAEKSGITSYFTSDKDDLAYRLKSCIKSGDVLLFKASRGMKLENVVNSIF